MSRPGPLLRPKYGWIPTAKGEAAGGVMTEVERSNETGMARQLRWASSIIDGLKPILKGGAA